MNKQLLNSITAAMLPLAMHTVAQPVGAYNYLGNRAKSATSQGATTLVQPREQNIAMQSLIQSPDAMDNTLADLSITSPSKPPHNQINSQVTNFPVSSDVTALHDTALHDTELNVIELEITQAKRINELIIIDQAVPDKQLFYKDLKPNTEVREIVSAEDGLAQLKQILAQYQNLEALHVVSHADSGVIYLGNSRIDQALLQAETTTLATMNASLNRGAEVSFYGCNLGAGDKGRSLLELIARQGDVDVQASNDLTGSIALGGDWDLEVSTGVMESEVPFSQHALQDFSAVLANLTVTMDGFTTKTYGDPKTYTSGNYGVRISSNNPGTNSMYVSNYGDAQFYEDWGGTRSGDKIYFDFTGGEQFNVTSIALYSSISQNLVIEAGNNSKAVTVGVVESTVALGWTGVTKLTIRSANGANLQFLRMDDFVLTNITAPNAAPTETGTFPTDITVLEDTASNLNLAGLTLSDSDSAGDMTLTLTASGGTLAASDNGGVVIAETNSNSLTLTGTISEIDTYLNTSSFIQYTGVLNENGNNARTVAVKINDGDGSGDVALGTFYVDITAVNDAPTLSATDSTTVSENTNAGAAIAIKDVANLAGYHLGDAGDAVSTMNITALTGPGTWQHSGNTVVSAAVSLTETQFNSLTYTPVNADENASANATATISYTLTDDGGTANGGADTSGSQTFTVNINAQDDAPVATGVSFSGTLQVGQLLTSSYSYADVEADSETSSSFIWYASNDANGTGKTPIATSANFTLTSAQADKYISVAVTPVNANASGAPVESAINATAVTGLTPEIALSQGATSIADGGSQDFGSQGVNSTTDLVFTISNSGTADLTLTNPALAGTDASEFSITANPTTPVAASGGSTTYTVRFTPTSPGAKSATLTIVNNDSDENPYNISITGTGLDVTAPVYQNSTPVLSAITTSGAELTVDLDEDSTVYYVVVAKDATPPSVSEVKAGTGSGGSGQLTAGNFSTTSTLGNQTVSGLAGNTAYDVYLVAQDDESTPNVQTSVTKITLTTAVDSDATLTDGDGVIESAVSIATTANTPSSAVAIMDFVLTDGGTSDTSDNTATVVTSLAIHVSGSNHNKLTYLLANASAGNNQGSDLGSAITGSYNAGTVTFDLPSSNISVANGTAETYVVKAFFNDNTGITDNTALTVSIDGDIDVTTAPQQHRARQWQPRVLLTIMALQR